jgi:dephospho-CoA kinase
MRTNHRKNYTIGLTGGIAMGKTTVATYLADRYQLPILDADIYAREAVAAGSPVGDRIFERYPAVRQADGTLDRAKLGAIVFAAPAERQWLEQQIHPVVRDRMITERARYHAAQPDVPVVWVVPLLFEAGLAGLVDEIWVVYCPREQQLQQLQRREPQLSPAQVVARIDSQMPIAQKCAQADVVLENTTTLAALLSQVDAAIAGKL